jgi:5-hydroxyisourate hydrolase-like protein (transthyretin family)
MSLELRQRVNLVMREVMVGMISLVVIAYTISYLHGQHDTSAFAIEITSTQLAAANSVVAYGRVVDQATNKPVRGARITLDRANGTGSYTLLGTTTAAADGTFRIESPATVAGSYRLVAEANVTAGTTRSAFAFAGTPGHAYHFNVNMVNKEYFVLLPLPGY